MWNHEDCLDSQLEFLVKLVVQYYNWYAALHAVSRYHVAVFGELLLTTSSFLFVSRSSNIARVSVEQSELQMQAV
jgi:hypothetical protein